MSINQCIYSSHNYQKNIQVEVWAIGHYGVFDPCADIPFSNCSGTQRVTRVLHATWVECNGPTGMNPVVFSCILGYHHAWLHYPSIYATTPQLQLIILLYEMYARLLQENQVSVVPSTWFFMQTRHHRHQIRFLQISDKTEQRWL